MEFIDKFFNTIKWQYTKYVIVPFLVAIAILILMNELIMPAYTRHGQAITVPNLVEMTYEGARTLLRQHDLVIMEREKKFDSRYRSGIIISQNPHAHASVKKGRRIYVVVSKGEPSVEMPNLIGISEENAIFEINRLGLQLGRVSYRHSFQNPYGVVDNQSIYPKEDIKIGETVDLVISLGNLPDRFVVPDLVGRSLKDAKKVIKQSGLNLGAISYRVEDSLLPETVIDQSIAGNTEVSQGDTLHLIVSKLSEIQEEVF